MILSLINIVLLIGPPPLVEVVSGNKVKSDQGPLKGT